MAGKSEAHKADEAIRAFAFKFPEVYEEFPWGHRALKVKGRTFAFVMVEEGGLNMSAKLPESSTAALNLPFTSPTGYGLGKSGWITSQFKPKEKPPLELLFQWIEESYRAIAPKKLVKQLDATRAGGDPAPKAAKTKPAAKRKTAQK